MEHLPTPTNVCTNEQTVVPYVCLKDYDGGPFLTYPTREGVTHALPLDGNIPGGSPYRQHEQTYPTPKHEQEDFLQRWLFFGLIREILGGRYRLENLTRTIKSDGRETKIVSLSGLVETLDKWIADIKTGCTKPCHTYEHIAECLRLDFATIHGAGPEFDPRVKLSLASLGELFTMAANEAYQALHSKCPDIFSYLIPSDYWESTMLQSGWCPSQIKVNFDNVMYLQTLHFFAVLSQPVSPEIHQRCNKKKCLAYQNDLATSQPKHITGCNCENLSIDTQRLTEILESGSLPLLRIQKGHTLNELSVELVPSQSTSQYIALSHVWADGLGNSKKNALPRCQLDLLHQIINEYYADVNPEAVEGVLLWCDVLCCPVKEGKAKDLALAQMEKPYLEAFRVLVLDSSLRMYDCKTMDTDEACVRILSSGWTRRLWTLQEGALAAKNFRLLFLFRDGPVNMHYLIHRVLQISTSSIGRKGLSTNILNRILNFASFSFEVDGNQRANLTSVEAGLQHRSVTFPEDEPLLVANLLDLDLVNILSGPCYVANCANVGGSENVGCKDSRIHRLWLLMPTAFQGIPRTILHRVGPRLSEPGFRWAPATLLHMEPLNNLLQPRVRSKNEDTSTATSYAIPTGRGLLVRFTGYSLSMARCPRGVPLNAWNMIDQEGSLYCRGIDGNWFLVDRRLSIERDDFLSSKSLRAIIKEEGNLWITHEQSAFNTPALVAEARDEQKPTIGLLVQLQSDEEEIKYVHSKLHIVIGPVQNNVRNLLETAYISAKQIPQNIPSGQLTQVHHGYQEETNEMDPSQYPFVQKLKQEIKRVAMQDTNPDVAAATATFSKSGNVLFEELIAMMLVGGYGCLGAKTAEEQEWCID